MPVCMANTKRQHFSRNHHQQQTTCNTYTYTHTVQVNGTSVCVHTLAHRRRHSPRIHDATGMPMASVSFWPCWMLTTCNRFSTAPRVNTASVSSCSLNVVGCFMILCLDYSWFTAPLFGSLPLYLVRCDYSWLAAMYIQVL